MVGGFVAPGYVLKYGYSMLRPLFLIMAALLILAQLVDYVELNGLTTKQQWDPDYSLTNSSYLERFTN